jgi:hypothetical protein
MFKIHHTVERRLFVRVIRGRWMLIVGLDASFDNITEACIQRNNVTSQCIIRERYTNYYDLLLVHHVLTDSAT